MNADRLWKILDAIQGQIRAFDTKAQIVIGINGILAGFFGASAGKLGETFAAAAGTWLSPWIIVFAVLTLLFMLGSILIAVFTIHPRLHLNQPQSRIFFAHISNEFGADYPRMRQSYECLTEHEHQADLENQILTVSTICCKKARLFKYALFSMAIALIAWVGMLGMQSRVAQNGKQVNGCSSVIVQM
jgi:hypothetical protein